MEVSWLSGSRAVHTCTEAEDMNCHTGVLTKTMEVGICIFGGHFSLLHYQGAII